MPAISGDMGRPYHRERRCPSGRLPAGWWYGRVRARWDQATRRASGRRTGGDPGSLTADGPGVVAADRGVAGGRRVLVRAGDADRGAGGRGRRALRASPGDLRCGERRGRWAGSDGPGCATRALAARLRPPADGAMAPEPAPADAAPVGPLDGAGRDARAASPPDAPAPAPRDAPALPSPDAPPPPAPDAAPACVVAPEVCDGRDNDCDGTVDDGFRVSSHRTSYTELLRHDARLHGGRALRGGLQPGGPPVLRGARVRQHRLRADREQRRRGRGGVCGRGGAAERERRRADLAPGRLRAQQPVQPGLQLRHPPVLPGPGLRQRLRPGRGQRHQLAGGLRGRRLTSRW